MPEHTPSSCYLSCKKAESSSFFNDPGTRNYQWQQLSPFLAEEAFEIGPQLKELALEALTQRYPDHDDHKLAKKIHKSVSNNKAKPLKLSLFHFEDELGNVNPRMFIVRCVNVIKYLLNDYKHSVAINYREIFYVPDGKSPPAHYRPGIDSTVNNFEAYRKGKQNLSYQLAKAIVRNFRPSGKKISTKTDRLIAYNYSNIRPHIESENIPSDLDIPLTHLPTFDSPLEAMVNAKYRHRAVVLTFSSLVTHLDLYEVIDHLLNSDFTKEIIIILQGEIYKNSDVRFRSYLHIKGIINALNCKNFVHIFLFPNGLVDKSLMEISATLETKIGKSFSPLAGKAGYYLSSSDIFEAVVGHIYEAGKRNITSKSFTFLEEARPSYNKHQSSTQTNLTFNREQALQQLQAVNQNLDVPRQNLNLQTLSINPKKPIDKLNPELFFPPLPITSYILKLQKDASESLKEWTKEKIAMEGMHYTSYYQDNFSKRHELERLVNDKKFVVKLFGRIVGLAHTKYLYPDNMDNSKTKSNRPVIKNGAQSERHKLRHFSTSPYEFIPLPNYSCESMEYWLPIRFFLAEFVDGVNPDLRRVGYSWIWRNRLLQGWKKISAAIPVNIDAGLEVPFSSLLNTNCQLHLNTELLLNDVPLTEAHEKEKLVRYASLLLQVFNANYQEDILKTEKIFLKFIDIFLNNNSIYLNIITRFFTFFEEHNRDNLRILLQLIMSSGKKNFEIFLEFLIYLDERALLRNFYKIYFQYTPTIFSLVNFFKLRENWHQIATKSFYEHAEAFFLKLIQRTPPTDSPENWPLLEQFCHAFLVFAAKNNIGVIQVNLTEIDQFWSRISAKFLTYCNGDREEAYLLLNRFVSGLLADDGLALASLGKLETLLTCLENLFDHCIAKHTLKEQLNELSGLSLAWIDVPYATAYNDFQIVSNDMKIESGSIGYGRNSYSVSLSELNTIIETHSLDRPDNRLDLRTALFRYLGKETAREELAFYRELLKVESPNPPSVFLSELIVAFYVSNYTGVNYTSPVNILSFVKQCRQFLSTHPQAKSWDYLLDCSLHNFVVSLNHIKINQQGGIVSLQMLWQEKDILNVTQANTELPGILTRKFSRKGLSHFLLKSQQEIQAILPLLSDEPMLANALVNNFFDEDKIHKYEPTLNLLETCYPSFGLSAFFEHLQEILVFIETLRVMPDPDNSIFLSLGTILRQQPDINLGIALLKLFADKLRENPVLDSHVALFLTYLGQHPSLLSDLINLKPALKLILDYYLSAKVENLDLSLVFELYNTLKGDASRLSENNIETLAILLNVMQSEEGYKFFHERDSLTRTQYKHIATLIKKIDEPSATLSFIELALREDSQTKFDEVIMCLDKFPRDKKTLLLQQTKELEALFDINFLPTLIRRYKEKPEEPLEIPPAAPVIPGQQKSRFWLKVGLVIAAVIIGILFSWIIIPLAIASAVVYLSVVLLSKLKTLFCFNKPEPVSLEEIVIHEEPCVGNEPAVVSASSRVDTSYDILSRSEEEEEASSIFATRGKEKRRDYPSQHSLFNPANQENTEVQVHTHLIAKL